MRKRIGPADRQAIMMPERVNKRWSMDFMSDVLSDRARVCTLNTVDDLSWECPAIEVNTSLPGARVVRVLERLAERRGPPKTEFPICYGPEQISKALDEWA